jgi:hypothetical protein
MLVADLKATYYNVVSERVSRLPAHIHSRRCAYKTSTSLAKIPTRLIILGILEAIKGVNEMSMKSYEEEMYRQK